MMHIDANSKKRAAYDVDMDSPKKHAAWIPNSDRLPKEDATKYAEFSQRGSLFEGLSGIAIQWKIIAMKVENLVDAGWFERFRNFALTGQRLDEKYVRMIYVEIQDKRRMFENSYGGISNQDVADFMRYLGYGDTTAQDTVMIENLDPQPSRELT